MSDGQLRSYVEAAMPLLREFPDNMSRLAAIRHRITAGNGILAQEILCEVMRERRRWLRTISSIYFATVECFDVLKIGRAMDIPRRMKELSAPGRRYHVIGAVPGHHAEEKTLLRRFRPHLAPMPYGWPIAREHFIRSKIQPDVDAILARGCVDLPEGLQ